MHEYRLGRWGQTHVNRRVYQANRLGILDPLAAPRRTAPVQLEDGGRDGEKRDSRFCEC